MRMAFQVDQYETSKSCIDTIQEYFGCGNIVARKTKMHSYRVQNTDNLRDTIIPHFKKYPLLTSKGSSFSKFVRIFDMTGGKWPPIHADPTSVVMLAYSMNPSGKRAKPLEYWLAKVDASPTAGLGAKLPTRPKK